MTRITELARFPHVAECNLYVGEGSPIDDVERRIGSWISGCSPRLDLYAGVEQWLRREVGDECGIVPVCNGRVLVGLTTAKALAAFEAFMAVPVPATLEDAVKSVRQLPAAEFRKLVNAQGGQRLAKHFFVEPVENRIVVRTAAGGVDWSPEVKKWQADTSRSLWMVHPASHSRCALLGASALRRRTLGAEIVGLKAQPNSERFVRYGPLWDAGNGGSTTFTATGLSGCSSRPRWP